MTDRCPNCRKLYAQLDTQRRMNDALSANNDTLMLRAEALDRENARLLTRCERLLAALEAGPRERGAVGGLGGLPDNPNYDIDLDDLVGLA